MTSWQIPVKRPHSPQSSETYKDSPTPKTSRYSPTMQPLVAFAISPFREMVVKLHPHLDRSDVVKMAYIMELPDTFEEEMGTLRDPLLYLVQVAERVGRVNGEDVDMLINSLVILKKPQDTVQIVREYKEKYLQPFQDASVWKKTTMQPDSEQKPVEKDYTKYWSKFQDWCGMQNVLDAKAASCKTVIDYLNSLTSSNKMATVMNYYKGILQHHQNFKSTDRLKLETCIKELKEKEKKTKN